MGLIVSIYRSDFRSRNNLLNDYKEITIVNVPGPFDPAPDRPAANLKLGFPGHFPFVEPDIDYLHGIGKFHNVAENDDVMMGGSFVYTSDSRFGMAIRDLSDSENDYYALPLHDLSRDLELGWAAQQDMERIAALMDEPQTDPEHV
jgi:hypothetical protein